MKIDQGPATSTELAHHLRDFARRLQSAGESLQAIRLHLVALELDHNPLDLPTRHHAQDLRTSADRLLNNPRPGVLAQAEKIEAYRQRLDTTPAPPT